MLIQLEFRMKIRNFYEAFIGDLIGSASWHPYSFNLSKAE